MYNLSVADMSVESHMTAGNVSVGMIPTYLTFFFIYDDFYTYVYF